MIQPVFVPVFILSYFLQISFLTNTSIFYFFVKTHKLYLRKHVQNVII